MQGKEAIGKVLTFRLFQTLQKKSVMWAQGVCFEHRQAFTDSNVPVLVTIGLEIVKSQPKVET